MKMCEIRWASKADAAAVADIACRCWEPIYEGYRQILGEEIYPIVYPDPIHLKREAVQLAVAEGRAFVAEAEGKICGFATFRTDGLVGTLGNNAVLPEYKGRGIAGMLFERIFKELRERGCTVVSVDTGLDEGHGPARRAYEKMGFEAGLPSIRYYKKL